MVARFNPVLQPRRDNAYVVCSREDKGHQSAPHTISERGPRKVFCKRVGVELDVESGTCRETRLPRQVSVLKRVLCGDHLDTRLGNEPMRLPCNHPKMEG